MWNAWGSAPHRCRGLTPTHTCPLSFLWDGKGVIVSTPRASRGLARHLRRGARSAREGWGSARRQHPTLRGLLSPLNDDGTKERVRHQGTAGIRAMKRATFAYFRIVPAPDPGWREVNELPPHVECEAVPGWLTSMLTARGINGALGSKRLGAHSTGRRASARPRTSTPSSGGASWCARSGSACGCARRPDHSIGDGGSS